MKLSELARLDMQPEIELLWPGTGYVSRPYFPESGWPIGAYFWRRVGETGWQPIPGRVWDTEAKQGKGP
jgi:hypothetical protein